MKMVEPKVSTDAVLTLCAPQRSQRLLRLISGSDGSTAFHVGGQVSRTHARGLATGELTQ